MFPYLVARMTEASSYAGFATMLLGMAHVNASSDLVNAALGVVTSLGGLLAFLVPEKAPAK